MSEFMKIVRRNKKKEIMFYTLDPETDEIKQMNEFEYDEFFTRLLSGNAMLFMTKIIIDNRLIERLRCTAAFLHVIKDFKSNDKKRDVKIAPIFGYQNTENEIVVIEINKNQRCSLHFKDRQQIL
jgi:hypothetical protein